MVLVAISHPPTRTMILLRSHSPALVSAVRSPLTNRRHSECCVERRFIPQLRMRKRSEKGRMECEAGGGGMFPVDPWAPTIDSESVAPQLFAASLIPYIGFLFFLTKSKSAPRLTLFGFYFLLAFVAATIPAGIYAKVHYGTSLSNVDWLHGAAESLLTLTNLFIVLGLRQSLREFQDDDNQLTSSTDRQLPTTQEQDNSLF